MQGAGKHNRAPVILHALPSFASSPMSLLVWSESSRAVQMLVTA